MAKQYEVVIFTAGMKDYADWALSQIGDGLVAKKCISHRLYRQHALPCREFYIKDLSLLGRDLNRTIIVDNISENFLLQPENGISIKSWYDDPADNALLQLAPLLLGIAKQKVSDVKLALRESKEQLLKMIIEGDNDPTQHLQNLSFS
jgi:CTD small phosphatase-like protein 2